VLLNETWLMPDIVKEAQNVSATTRKSRGHRRSLAIVQKFFPKVTTVKDGTDDLEVEVTKQDATSSRKKDHNNCAMAVACKRKAKADGIIISISMAYIIKGNTATRYQVPNSVGREITAFDRGARFAEGNYELKAQMSHTASTVAVRELGERP